MIVMIGSLITQLCSISGEYDSENDTGTGNYNVCFITSFLLHPGTFK